MSRYPAMLYGTLVFFRDSRATAMNASFRVYEIQKVAFIVIYIMALCTVIFTEQMALL